MEVDQFIKQSRAQNKFTAVFTSDRYTVASPQSICIESPGGKDSERVPSVFSPKLAHQTSDGGLTTGEPQFIHQPVIDPFRTVRYPGT